MNTDNSEHFKWNTVLTRHRTIIANNCNCKWLLREQKIYPFKTRLIDSENPVTKHIFWIKWHIKKINICYTFHSITIIAHKQNGKLLNINIASVILFLTIKGMSWPWSYGSWSYNYLCNQFLSPLMWVRISIKVRCTTLCDKVCLWLATGQWFSLGPQVSSTNKLTTTI